MTESEQTSPEKSETFRTEYREVCQSHRAVTEFRAKLLALLPIATGTGLFLLLKGEIEAEIPHLAAIGLFGFIATLGLFFHEVHAIAQCWDLILRGVQLEKSLGLGRGQFGVLVANKTEHLRFNRIVGPEGAAAVIYPTMMSAWLYLAAFGGRLIVNNRCNIVLAGITWILIVLVGFWLCWRNIKLPSYQIKPGPDDAA